MSDGDTIEYIYKETCSKLTTETLAENGWVSPNAQSRLVVNTDETAGGRGNYVYFNANTDTRNVKVTFPENMELTEDYILEMDFGLASGGGGSEFTVLTSDTVVKSNSAVTGDYLLQFKAPGKSNSGTTSMVWNVNGSETDTVTFTQRGTNPIWAHLKMTVHMDGDIDVVVTENDEEIYSNVLKAVNPDNLSAVGFNFNGVKAYGKCQFDNIKVYAASELPK